MVSMVMWRRKSIVGAVALSLVLPSVTACTTTREDRIGKNDGSDSCYAYRVALDDTRSFYSEDMLKGALAGAAVGLTIALLSGAKGGTTALSVVGGALAGAAIGGFWSELERQQGRDQALQSALGSARKDNENLRKTESALNSLVNCRRSQIAAVKADYKAKRISKQDGELRLADIRAKLEQDYAIASEIDQNVTKRQDEYLFALDKVNPGAATRVKAKPQTQAKARPNTAKPEQQFESETASVLISAQGINKGAKDLQVASKAASNLDA